MTFTLKANSFMVAPTLLPSRTGRAGALCWWWVVRARLARPEVNYGRLFFGEGQCVAVTSAVEVTGLGFVDHFAARSIGRRDRIYAQSLSCPLVARPLPPRLCSFPPNICLQPSDERHAMLENSRAREIVAVATSFCSDTLRARFSGFATAIVWGARMSWRADRSRASAKVRCQGSRQLQQWWQWRWQRRRRDEIGSFVEPRFRHAVDRTVDLVSAAFAELSAAFTARVRVFHRGVSCGLGIDLWRSFIS